MNSSLMEEELIKSKQCTPTRRISGPTGGEFPRAKLDTDYYDLATRSHTYRPGAYLLYMARYMYMYMLIYNSCSL